jgi:MFS transporter, UMF1 family
VAERAKRDNDSRRRVERGSALGRISWALFDWAISPFATMILTFVFASYFTEQVVQDSTRGTAIWGTTLGATGVLIALGGPFLGSAADQTGRRKGWIAVFTAVFGLATAGLWFVRPSPASIPLAVVLVATALVAEEWTQIFYNAMLGPLTRAQSVGRWSGWGWALGYLGGLACLVLALLFFVLPEKAFLPLDYDEAEHVRITFVLVTVWLAVFSLPFFLFTPDAPYTGKPLRRAARDGLKQLRGTLRHVRGFKHILWFLVARTIYVDGLAATFAFGGVYAAGTFGMGQDLVMMFGITLSLTAGLGAFGLAWVDDWIGPKRTIMLSLAGLIVPGTVILFVEDRKWFWFCGAVLGIFVGPVQAASRSYLSRAIPDELRTQMFGLYAFSGKATAFLAPVLVGWVTHWTQSQRAGMGVILVLFVVGLALMFKVPPADKAKEYTERVERERKR